MSSLQDFGLAAWLIAIFLTLSTTAQSWKHYPLVLETDPPITFPQIEGAQYQDMGDSWFMTAQVTGETTGKKYQIVNIFDRNYITLAILNFYQVSIFDYETTEYVTYTDYDYPVLDLLGMKLSAASDGLELGFNSSAGNATWTTLSPFDYQLHCPGIDHQGQGEFVFDLNFNMTKKPVPYGADTLRGYFEFYAQNKTLTYFQTGPNITGSLTMKGVTENVAGTYGHLDRQIFPLYGGVFSPTGKEHSHEWRQINLFNGVDLAIWRQFDRTQNNTIIETSGTTASPAGTESTPEWTDELHDDFTVEYINYSKYPQGTFQTLLPPGSNNTYFPADHIIRSKALEMELQCTYINKVPAVTLPIEYFEGPAIYNGTYKGAAVNGIGIFESTLSLFRDWELAKVLYDSVVHLPDSDFSPAMTRAQIATVVNGVNQYVSSNLLADNVLAAKPYIEKHIIPALQTMVNGTDKDYMLEIAQDLDSSLGLLLQL